MFCRNFDPRQFKDFLLKVGNEANPRFRWLFFVHECLFCVDSFVHEHVHGKILFKSRHF